MRGESYSGWGWSFSQSQKAYQPLVDYDKSSEKRPFFPIKKKEKTLADIEILSPGVCPICHCALPLSGKCDCQ